MEPMTVSDLIAAYVTAKDSNRAHLMSAAFAPTATLEMVVKAGTISFPPHASGLDAITDVLVRRFGSTFENVYTFCLCSQPTSDESTFSCAWLVGMSEKVDGAVRVGSGRYDWFFSRGDPRRVERLKITIEQMEVLDVGHLPIVMSWLSRLPYPWCPVEAAIEAAPKELRGLARRLLETGNEDA